MSKNNIISIDVAQIRCGEGGVGGKLSNVCLCHVYPVLKYLHALQVWRRGGWGGEGGGKFKRVVVLHARARTTSTET